MKKYLFCNLVIKEISFPVDILCLCCHIRADVNVHVYKNSSRHSQFAPNPSRELFNLQRWGKRLSSVDRCVNLSACVPETPANNSRIYSCSSHIMPSSNSNFGLDIIIQVTQQDETEEGKNNAKCNKQNETNHEITYSDAK